jgi:hypothetical protein
MTIVMKEVIYMLKAEIKPCQYNVTKTVRINSEMAEELEFIALYETAKPGTLMRMWLQDRIQTYLRNPKYKRWRKRLSLIPLKKISE